MVSEPKVTNEGFPYERQAKDGNEMPNGLEYPDQVLYLCFRMLYAQLKQGIIDRETAIREKKKLLREYESYKFIDQMGKQWVQVIKDTETARSEYRKCRTIENADKLLIAIDGGDYGKHLS